MAVNHDDRCSCVPARAATRTRGPALFLLALAFFAVVLQWPSLGWADGRTCDGPTACCPAKITDSLAGHVEVAVGITLVGLYNVNEKAGTWNADFYLREVWMPASEFTPQTEIVNEVSRQAQQFDTTSLREGRCVRSRRIHSTLQNPYNLRTFPFDHQRLTLQLSDSQFPIEQTTYSARPATMEIDEAARDQLSSWKLEGDLAYVHASRAFKGEEGAPSYDYATFSLPVRRHITFHLTKFFLPLLVIVIVAFSTFWIDADDLSSRVGLGVTCLLTAIAFQTAEAGSLPEVEYLTLADRAYASCYVALALAILESVYMNALARRGQKPRAVTLDRRARLVFPSVLMVALVLGGLRAFLQGVG